MPLRTAALGATVIIAFAALASAQPAESGAELTVTPAPSTRPISLQERRDWVVEGTLAPKSFGAGLMIATWQTAMSSPREWEGSSGFTKRVLSNQADNGISKGIEASLGLLWGEDPRSTRSGRHGIGSRLGYATKTVVLAPRRDGHLAPAWGRFAGAVGSNVAKNAWLPSRLTTPKETTWRIAAALAGRLATNLWQEFGPDLRRRFARERSGLATASPRPAPIATPPATVPELSVLGVTSCAVELPGCS